MRKTKKTISRTDSHKLIKTTRPRATVQYRSRLLAGIHETATDLFDAGVIAKKTMREFDESCLTPMRSLSAKEIREIREGTGVSQRVFALYLNVSPSVITQWERGKKQPAGASLKLLSLVAKKGLESVA